MWNVAEEKGEGRGGGGDEGREEGLEADRKSQVVASQKVEVLVST